MAEPKTIEEYNERFAACSKVSGFGMKTTVHSPCPFCAAPDWIVARILDVEVASSKGAVCKECGRGARAIYARAHGSVSFEFVQTGGAPMPAFLPPMRLVLDPPKP